MSGRRGPSDARGVARLRVVGGARVLRDAAGRAAAEVVARGLDADRRADVELAVHEILANAFEHGHLGDPDLPIDVEVAEGDGGGATVTVTDAAVSGPWRPAQRPSPAATEERGRGLVLARAGSDGLTLRSAVGVTTVVLAWRPSDPLQSDERG